jgi:hypothetical protein
MKIDVEGFIPSRRLFPEGQQQKQYFGVHKSNVLCFIHQVTKCLPVTVAGRCKECPVFASSEAGIVGSNPTQGMDI